MNHTDLCTQLLKLIHTDLCSQLVTELYLTGLFRVIYTKLYSQRQETCYTDQWVQCKTFHLKNLLLQTIIPEYLFLKSLLHDKQYKSVITMMYEQL